MTSPDATPAVDRDAELRRLAVDRLQHRRNFQVHVVAYLVGGLVLAIVWAVTEYHNAGGWPTAFRTGRMNHDWDPWIMYPLLAGAVSLAVHGWVAYGRRPPTEYDIEREIARARGSRA